MTKRIISTIITILMLISFIPVWEVQAATTSTNINIGDYVQMGKYYDEPILWRCVDIDANGPLMLSDKILTIKAFDAAGEHKYLDGSAQADDGQRTSYGSNLWQTSNMRSWLNSSAVAGKVDWLDKCPPTADKLWYVDGFFVSNAYAGEKGFLAEGNFTSSEQNAIKSVTQKSLLNGIDVKLREGGTAEHIYDPSIATIVQNYDTTAYYQMVTDKIFLLDVKQLNKVYQNSNVLGIDYWIGKLTQKAVDNSYKYSEAIVGENCFNWIRSPYIDSNYPKDVRLVNPYGSPTSQRSYCDLGVRPAFYINLSSEIFKSGNGSIGTPYSMDGTGSEPPTTTPIPDVEISTPQTTTQITPNLTIKADKVEKISDSIQKNSGNVAISDWLKLDGEMTFDSDNLEIKGTGRLYIESNLKHFNGHIDIYNGSFTLNADSAEIFKENGVDSIKVGGLTLEISKFQLIKNGIRLGGKLSLPKTIGGYVQIDKLEIINGKINFPNGEIALPDFKLGSSNVGLSEAYVKYASENNVFEGHAKLEIPKMFGIEGTVGFQNAKLNKVGLGISGMNVAIGTTGLFLNRIAGEVSGISVDPLIIKAEADVSTAASLLKGKELTIEIDTSGKLSGSGTLTLMDLDLANASFSIEYGKGFTAHAGIDVADVVKGDLDIMVNTNPSFKFQGSGTVEVNTHIPFVDTLKASAYLDQEMIKIGLDAGVAKGVFWVKYDDCLENYGFELNAELVNNTESVNKIMTVGNTFEVPQGIGQAMIKLTSNSIDQDFSIKAPDASIFNSENSPITSTTANYIKIDNQKTASFLLNSPMAGTWEYTLKNPAEGGTVSVYKIKEPQTINITSQVQDTAVKVAVGATTSNQVPINWTTNADTESKVDLYYSTDPQAKMGTPIAVDLDPSTKSYTWNIENSMISGSYYVFAVLKNAKTIPYYSYTTGKVIVNNLNTPSTPTGFTVKSINGNISATWNSNSEANLEGYKIYVTDDKQNEKIYGTSNVNKFLISGLDTGKAYNIAISALSDAGLESEKSQVETLNLDVLVPPTMSINWPVQTITNVGTAVITGNIQAGATAVLYKNDNIIAENLSGNFNCSVNFEDGDNTIKIVTSNPNGDSVEAEKEYYYDKTPPQLTVDNITPEMKVYTDYIEITGNVEPLSELSINSEVVTNDNTGRYSYKLNLNGGSNKVVITAKDISGNKTIFNGNINADYIPVLKGDINKDGVIDSKDLSVLKTNILSSSNNIINDINNDGKVNIIDYITLSKMVIKNPDLNKDGVIDSKDLTILKTNILSNSNNTIYDINNDGKINILDYIALSKMFVKTPLTDSTNITSAFTDVNFKSEVYKLIGKNGPVPILYSDVKNIKNINVSSKNISSLNGVEYFTSLTSLYCGDNQLTTLDISKNTTLNTLACSSNKLTTLDVSKNISLNYLDCGNNQLVTLDVSKNTALTFLDCQKNILPSLNVVSNVKLTYLSCADNKLATLDVSKNTALTFLNCSYNNITTLSSIKNTWYTDFYKTQYTDTTKINTTNTLVITIKN